MASKIQHIFVLMLENRSFDHLLGFSGIEGTDAVTGERRKIDGVTRSESNTYKGETYRVSPTALATLAVDPAHEFADVVTQLCGEGATFPATREYPPIVNTGFAASYGALKGAAPADVMKGYPPAHVPSLVALAESFAVCDNWHASVPGPTWPNRFFACAATSGGLEHSPSLAEILLWETLDGFSFPAGSLFDLLKKKAIRYRIYRGDVNATGGWLPSVTALKGVSIFDTHPFSGFARDLADARIYPDGGPTYTFIEPDYGDVLGNTFRGGASHHPLDGIDGGDRLIADTYEAIRRSRVWEGSLLIVTWDEHGGFYDHVTPPRAPIPHASDPTSKRNRTGFRFDRYGVRVPAVVVSPYIAKNVVDPRLYDHASIPATVERCFGLDALTQRDAGANGLGALVTLPTPRTDTPVTLPRIAAAPAAIESAVAWISPPDATPIAEAPDAPNQGNLPLFLYIARKIDAELPPPSGVGAKRPLADSLEGVATVGDARGYVNGIAQRLAVAEAAKAAG